MKKNNIRNNKSIKKYVKNASVSKDIEKRVVKKKKLSKQSKIIIIVVSILLIVSLLFVIFLKVTSKFRYDKYDDEYDFASTVKGTIYHLKLLHTKILRIPISIAKTEGDGQEIIIPLLVKAEMFQQDPTADDLIKSHCWLAGRLIDRK